MNAPSVKLVAQRMAHGWGSLLAVSVIVFAITAVLPGDAARGELGQDATPEAVAALRRDGPRPARPSATSLARRAGARRPRHVVGQPPPVAELIASRLPNSLLLAGGHGRCSRCRSPCCSASRGACGAARGSTVPRRPRGRRGLGARVPGRHAGRADLRRPAEVAAGARLGQRHRSARPDARAFAMPVLTLCCVIVAQMMRMTRAPR